MNFIDQAIPASNYQRLISNEFNQIHDDDHLVEEVHITHIQKVSV